MQQPDLFPQLQQVPHYTAPQSIHYALLLPTSFVTHTKRYEAASKKNLDPDPLCCPGSIMISYSINIRTVVISYFWLSLFIIKSMCLYKSLNFWVASTWFIARTVSHVE